MILYVQGRILVVRVEMFQLYCVTDKVSLQMLCERAKFTAYETLLPEVNTEVDKRKHNAGMYAL